jgi:16S rRNA (uracil1498-N3)-methyltransferase
VADRFYCPARPVDGRFTLVEDEARHLLRVRRLGLNDRVEIFDGRGFATVAEVVAVGRDRVELTAVGEPLPDRAAPLDLTLVTAVPKGERFAWLVEKATELGAARLIPMRTERSVVDPRDTKIDRLRRTISEAAKQCGRNRLMELDLPSAWTSLVSQVSDPVKLFAHPGGLAPAAWPRIERGCSATLAIGPEGGFTEAEAEAAKANGWTVISLGSTLLRIETAGLAGCSAILALCEGWEE